MTAGVCRHCACTETRPCEGGCAWADPAQTICTICQDAANTAREFVRVLGITSARRGYNVETANFDLLPIAGQTALVQLCRTLVDNVRGAIAEAVEEEAAHAIQQLDAISAFLMAQCPDQVREDDTAADVTIRLLTPHVGSRLVLPGGAR